MNNFNTIQLYKDFITGFDNSKKTYGQPINGIIKIVVDIDDDNIINTHNQIINTSNIPLVFKLKNNNDLQYKSVSEYQKNKNKPSFPFICDI